MRTDADNAPQARETRKNGAPLALDLNALFPKLNKLHREAVLELFREGLRISLDDSETLVEQKNAVYALHLEFGRIVSRATFYRYLKRCPMNFPATRRAFRVWAVRSGIVTDDLDS